MIVQKQSLVVLQAKFVKSFLHLGKTVAMYIWFQGHAMVA
uniref:Uncharacterized protein n=1 Tax=Rhizophora mucronata TaxID=61149 RepID=A0A2P2Q4C4_RHIMU